MYACVWAHTGEYTCTFMHACACGHLRLMTGIILDNSSIIFNEAGSTSLLALGILPLEGKVTGRATLTHHLYDLRIQTMFPCLCHTCLKN